MLNRMLDVQYHKPFVTINVYFAVPLHWNKYKTHYIFIFNESIEAESIIRQDFLSHFTIQPVSNFLSMQMPDWNPLNIVFFE